MIEYQNIIIAPDVFKFIKESYSDPRLEDLDLKSYRNNLKLKCLILDKDKKDSALLSSLKEAYRDSSDFTKIKLESLIEEFLQSQRVKFKSIKECENIVENSNHNYLFNLANISNTKIINSQFDLLLYKLKIDNFELLNIDEIINPPAHSEIFSLNRDIELKKGEKFNIYEILSFYWINTKSLIIEDDYLRKLDDLGNHKEGQFPKLVRLIKTCKNLESLIIRTPFKDSKQSSKLYLDKNDFISEIVKQTNIIPIIEEAKVGERHYYTDYFKIHLGKGLDFFDIRQGYRIWRPKVTIRISPLSNQELI